MAHVTGFLPQLARSAIPCSEKFISLQLWRAYLAAVFVISGTPGPNMLLAMTHGIHHGLAATGRSTMPGLLAGLAVILGVSLGGLGAVLLASSYSFEVVKYIGAAYLIYLGFQTWRSGDVRFDTGHAPDAHSAWERFRIGILVALSNPKAILFGVAFFPQFLDPTLPMTRQAAILLLSFIAIETGWMCVYAGGGEKLAAWLRQGGRIRWFNRMAGGAFVGAGVLLGLFRR